MIGFSFLTKLVFIIQFKESKRHLSQLIRLTGIGTLLKEITDDANTENEVNESQDSDGV